MQRNIKYPTDRLLAVVNSKLLGSVFPSSQPSTITIHSPLDAASNQ
jgi:hypothetical protein